eukprot:CAMPEP_0114581658 /NCGR_PEP_ID=MMETSP0125-20121206/5744_1 /TAXON_ID=485358 ORGANISM="Aristerostoma sp., Strain ATCC 50986" /NCGR_SAMPLE_ID=MMETSP0125 /ASSEMBLY_ACC=CAM_ASM_000245 /LENGTH=57 /DNA_ID=CAMNT_0001774041 /DNA_START=63 /DNA_END=236 /DNA_ORIENTATION=+
MTQPPEEFPTYEDLPDHLHPAFHQLISPKEGPSSVGTTFIKDVEDQMEVQNQPDIES